MRQPIHHKFNHMDIDGNLVKVDNKFYFEELQADGSRKLIKVDDEGLNNIRSIMGPTDDFDYMYPGGEIKKTYDDTFNDNTFLNNMRKVIVEDLFGPSHEKFEKAVRQASVIEFNTARGHSKECMRTVKQRMITAATHTHSAFLASMQQKYGRNFDFHDALELYLDQCYDYAIHSDSFTQKFLGGAGNYIKVPDAKVIAVKDALLRHSASIPKNEPISFGFSDDTKSNVDAVARYFNEAKGNPDFKNIHMVTYYTPHDGPLEKEVHTRKEDIYRALSLV